VKGYATHESRTLGEVTAARAAAMRAKEPRERSEAEARLTSALGLVNAVAEDYPDLRASESFEQLQKELAELEDEIHAARRIYNGNVETYNTRIQVFPNSIVAGRGFEPRAFFRLESAAERAVPAVSFE
jgi:LemA protein